MTSRQIAVVVACALGILLTVAWVVGDPQVKVPSEVVHKKYPPTMSPQEEWGS